MPGEGPAHEGGNMPMNKEELLARLMEIREACRIAALPNDSNLNLIIEEIDRLALACLDHLKEA